MLRLLLLRRQLMLQALLLLALLLLLVLVVLGCLQALRLWELVRLPVEVSVVGWEVGAATAAVWL